MRVSDLNRKITFQNKDVEVDEIGNHKSVWMDYITTSAYISFTVRFQNKLKNINTSEYRILFDDEKYNIISIDFMNYKNRLIKFRCRKVSRWM